jgi:hypothetical protein
MKNGLAFLSLILLPFVAMAQESSEIEWVSEDTPPALRVSAPARDVGNKTLQEYALATLKQKTPTVINVGSASKTVVSVKNTQTGKIHKIVTDVYDLEPANAGDKAVASIINITDQVTGKSYKAILYDKLGDGTQVEEFALSSTNGRLRVGGQASFISCVCGKCGYPLSAIAHCKGSWTSRLKCIATTFGICYPVSAAKCAWKLLW